MKTSLSFSRAKASNNYLDLMMKASERKSFDD